VVHGDEPFCCYSNCPRNRYGWASSVEREGALPNFTIRRQIGRNLDLDQISERDDYSRPNGSFLRFEPVAPSARRC